MLGRIPRKEIAKRILKGIANAQRDYVRWSGGFWLWKAPEYMLTVYIAREIEKIENKEYYITLENSAKDAMSDAGAIGKGRLHSDIRKDGRFDLVLWWASGSPRSVIEVKNRDGSFSDTIKQDILRINKVLDRNKEKSTFRSGFMAFYISYSDSIRIPNAKKECENRIKEFHQKTKDIMRDKEVKLDYELRGKRTDAWAAVVLTITRKNK